MTEPTDAELDALRQADNGALNFVTARAFRIIARTVLAKWGTPPAVAGEHKPGCPALGGYGHGVEACCCGATPQPTQAQAGAVPLPKSYQASVLTSNSHDSGCRVSFSFGSVAEAEAWHESLIDQRHGIKGGQHGTDN